MYRIDCISMQNIMDYKDEKLYVLNILKKNPFNIEKIIPWTTD